MNFCIKIPVKFKFKRFNKTYGKLNYLVDHQFKTNAIKRSPQFVCGLKALENGRFTDRLLNRAILTLRRAVGKGRASWPRIRLSMNLRIPITRKSTGHRMGSGKGAVRSWGTTVRSGTFIFKIHRSPIKYSSYNSFDWTTIFAFFEYMDTVSVVYDRRFYIFDTYESLLSTKTVSMFRNSLILHKKNLRRNIRLVILIRRLFFSRLFREDFSGFKVSKKSKFKVPPIAIQYIRAFAKFSFRNNRGIANVIAPVLLFLHSNAIRKAFRIKFRFKRMALKSAVHLGAFKNKFFYSAMEPSKHKPKVFVYSFLDSFLHAERSQRYGQAKLSYIVSLFRGMYRVKKKLPFRSEILFFSDYDDGCSVYREIKLKRTALKQLSQRR